MLGILGSSWAMFLGLFLLMVGNGLQGSLLGLRGALEGFSPTTMSWVMSAYFLGFLGGSRLAPIMIRRVGHVRVFAALASLISAAFILFAAIPDPVAWALMRLLVGFCFSGVYVVAESWLSAASTNENRGSVLSVYLIVQMVGIIAAQGLLNLASPADYALFVLISVLVSVSFAPILLSVSPAPVFETARRMTLVEVYRASPLATIGSFLLGGVFSAMFGMAAVYAGVKGLSVAETSVMTGIMYFGGMVAQYPVGWLSDRMDRRLLIVGVTAVGAATTLLMLPGPDIRVIIYAVAFIVGGVGNPLYSLLIAHANDFLETDDMAAASAGLVFFNGLGATIGPMVIGFLMTVFGPDAYFAFIGMLFAAIASYGSYRMTRRAAPEETASYPAYTPQASPVVIEVAQEVAIEMAQEDTEEEPAA